MSTSLQIRPVGTADHVAWLPLWEGYQHFYKTEIVTAAGDAIWQRFLDTGEPMNAALAWLGERIVGLVRWIYHHFCWTVGDYCYLQDLSVAGDLRGGGIERRLIEHIYTKADAAGCLRVHQLTHENNSDAMKLYERIADESDLLQYRKIL